MNRKDILELKKRFKKEQCTFTKVSGCYVNSEKEVVLEFKETFLNLPDDELFKYLEITKKALSGKVGNNLLELNFNHGENGENEKQQLLMRISRSGLKEDVLLKIFYESVIDSFDYSGNYLILLFHDVYDVMVKTSDKRKLDESEEVYEYIICAICPVSLSKPGLGYFKDEQKIKSRIRDWIVEVPTIGFTYPAFIDRSSDVDAVMYYTKNAKDAHDELMENALGCSVMQTATIQKETFQSIVEKVVSGDDEISEEIYTEIQENLNSMVEDYNETYEDVEVEPIKLSKEKVRTLLKDSGVPEETSVKIETSFEESFGDEPPLAEHLIDSKLIKNNAQKKKEKELLSQIEALETKLDLVADNGIQDQDIEEIDPVEEIVENPVNLESDDPTSNYDVVLHVKPEKLSSIKTELINGQRCILVPINDDEQATINGLEDLI